MPISPAVRRAARWVAVVAGAAAIVILALRSAIGPYRLWVVHVDVYSPLFSESAFWIAIAALLFFGHESDVGIRIDNPVSPGFPAAYLAASLGATAIAFAHNLADPFLSDDYILLREPTVHWKDFVASLSTAGGDGSFRPLTAVYRQLLKNLAGFSPFEWHLAALSLHLLDAALVFLLAWRLWRNRAAAVVACLLFGLHGTRPEALWMAANCDLLACACVLGSIHLAMLQRTRIGLILSLALVAAGILFKESAYAAPLVAAAVFMTQRDRSLRQSRPYLIGSTFICAALFAWRWHLFHGPGGYINRANGKPAILSLNPLTTAKAVFIRIWAILLTPVNWDAPMSWWFPIALLCSMLGLLLLVALYSSRACRRTSLYLVAATCCAVLPALHLALIGQSEQGSRVLYLAGAPFALLIGNLMPGGGRRGMVFAIVMLAGMAGILEHNLAAWHDAALRARGLCRAAAPSAPGVYEGVPLFQNGYPECLAEANGTFP